MPSSHASPSTANDQNPPAKRRRRESSTMPAEPAVVENGDSVPKLPAQKEQPALQESLTALTSIFDGIRSTLTCNICLRLLYEPYTMSCGHTHCYTCLTQWFDSNAKNGEDNTCPNCRTVISVTPAPSYLIRELTHRIIKHREFLPEDETCEEHAQLAAEEATLIENDRADADDPTGGLFPGHFPLHKLRNMPLYDHEDGISRCPDCTWELEEEDYCHRCGWSMDDDEDDSDQSGLRGTFTEDEEDVDDDFNPPDTDFETSLGALRHSLTVSRNIFEIAGLSADDYPGAYGSGRGEINEVHIDHSDDEENDEDEEEDGSASSLRDFIDDNEEDESDDSSSTSAPYSGYADPVQFSNYVQREGANASDWTTDDSGSDGEDEEVAIDGEDEAEEDDGEDTDIQHGSQHLPISVDSEPSVDDEEGEEEEEDDDDDDDEGPIRGGIARRTHFRSNLRQRGVS